MLFIVASIIFFLLSIRLILLWTYFWQKNGYSLRLVIASIQQLPLSTFLWHISLPVLLFFLIFLYSGVIFNDALTSIYHVLVTFVVFAYIAGISLKFYSGSMQLPQFSVKALIISLVTTFLVAFLYMIPLVDNFLWLIILLIIIPLLIALLVTLLAFPTEIYEDYLAAKTKGALRKKHVVFIAVVGLHSSTVKAYARTAFKKSSKIYVEQAEGFVSVAHSLQNNVTDNKTFYVLEMPKIQDDRIKIASITKPAICVVTSDVKDEKAYKELIHSFPRNVMLLSYKKNIVFNQLAQKNRKHILLYGLQKSAVKRGVDIFGYNVEDREKGITLTINRQGEITLVEHVKVSLEELPHILPTVFLKQLRPLHMGIKK